MADKNIEEATNAFHTGPTPPTVIFSCDKRPALADVQGNGSFSTAHLTNVT